ncbi:MAG: GNAT family N-acetyltransferase, partial [Cellvibrionaceae bacterium]
KHAKSAADQHGWEHIEYRMCDDNLDLPSASRKVSMILKLPGDITQLDNDLGAKVRAQCKQADRHEPQIVFGSVELLDEFYRVFSRNMRDLGTPVYPKVFFKTILEELPRHCTIVVVRLGQAAVGTAFLAGYKDMLEIPWASTRREYNSYNINMWMYRQMLIHTIKNGYDYFDFGRSTINAGTYQFKKQWGAKPLQHHWYYHLAPDKALPQLNPDNPRYRLAIAAWKRLPVFVANILGPSIVKHLP